MVESKLFGRREIWRKLWVVTDQGPFHERFSIVIPIRWKLPSPLIQVIVKWSLCTWHDSCAVVASAKFCSHMIPYNWVTLKPIWIMMEKIVSETGPSIRMNINPFYKRIYGSYPYMKSSWRTTISWCWFFLAFEMPAARFLHKRIENISKTKESENHKVNVLFYMKRDISYTTIINGWHYW